MFSGRINNCYDSHVHLLATGEVAERLDLHHLTSPEDLSSLTIAPHHVRNDWLIGFGWDQNNWPSKEFPRREHLDQKFGDRKVAFSRADGHALWVSTEGLKAAGLWQKNPEPSTQGRMILDAEGWPTGVLIDKARSAVDLKIGEPSIFEIRRGLLRAIQLFNQNGFTHVRDLTCHPDQWEQLIHLHDSGLLTLAIEQFFSVDEGQDFPKALRLAKDARAWIGRQNKSIRTGGIKVFLDGALGSEGAWISCPYHSGSGHGLQFFSSAELKALMEVAFHNKFDLAVHAIGDAAAHQALEVFCSLTARFPEQTLHLEHAELLRPDTLNMMRGQRVHCHMQPSHFLSDQKWLKEKLGTLTSFAFPWAALEKSQVNFDFGSDSPIELPSLERTERALFESQRLGIEGLLEPWTLRHSHPDLGWVPNCYTILTNGEIKEVVFQGEHLL